MNSLSHWWEFDFFPLVGKKSFPLVRIPQNKERKEVVMKKREDEGQMREDEEFKGGEGYSRLEERLKKIENRSETARETIHGTNRVLMGGWSLD